MEEKVRGGDAAGREDAHEGIRRGETRHFVWVALLVEMNIYAGIKADHWASALHMGALPSCTRRGRKESNNQDMHM